jgi:hypothetical protein
MLTTTYQQIETLAAVRAGRADDSSPTNLKLTPAEAQSILDVIADELPDLWTKEAWPELCDHLEAVTLDADHCFSLRLGDADEMGDILALIAGGDPRTQTAVTPLPRESWTLLDGRVNVLQPAPGPLYVDWQTPCPDLLSVASADLAAYELPRRFRGPLAWLAAAALLEDEDPERAARATGKAMADLLKQASRIKRVWWRQ